MGTRCGAGTKRWVTRGRAARPRELPRPRRPRTVLTPSRTPSVPPESISPGNSVAIVLPLPYGRCRMPIRSHCRAAAAANRVRRGNARRKCRKTSPPGNCPPEMMPSEMLRSSCYFRWQRPPTSQSRRALSDGTEPTRKKEGERGPTARHGPDPRTQGGGPPQAENSKSRAKSCHFV